MYDILYPANLVYLFLVLIGFGGVLDVSMYKIMLSANEKVLLIYLLFRCLTSFSDLIVLKTSITMLNRSGKKVEILILFLILKKNLYYIINYDIRCVIIIHGLYDDELNSFYI